MAVENHRVWRPLTISGLPRTVLCPPSEFLPHSIDLSEAPPATRGRIIHGFLRDVSLHGVEYALAQVTGEHYAACASIRVDLLPACEPDLYIPEVAFAYDWDADTAREINRGTDSRDYGPLGPTEIAGRADVVGITEVNGLRYVVICDYKTGFQYLGPAATSLQLGAYALAAARAYGCVGAIVMFIRIKPDGEPFFERAELDGLALDSIAVRIRTTMEQVLAMRAVPPRLDELTFAYGLHCKYCPARRRCPEFGSLIEWVVAIGQARKADPSKPVDINPAMAKDAFTRYEVAKFGMKELRLGLEVMAPIELDGGRVFGEVMSPREELNVVRGAAVLGQRFGPDFAVAVIKAVPELTKTSLKRGAEEFIERHPELKLKVTPLVREALDALRAGGAAVVNQRLKIKVHKPRTGEVESDEEEG